MIRNKIEYNGLCKQLENSFKLFSEYLKDELKSNVFNMTSEEFEKAKIKSQYLDEIVNIIKNEIIK